MKKFYTLMVATLATIGFVSAQCTIDMNNTTEFNPDPTSVPTALIGASYDEVLQFYIPTAKTISVSGITGTAYIDSVVLNDVTGLPAGLSWSKNPAGPTFLPGSNGCGRTQGTPTGPSGNYPLSFDGRIYFHVDTMVFGFPVNFDTSFTIDQYLETEYGSTFSINVDDPNGINEFNAELNSAVSVYPNPSTGIVNFNLNAVNRVNGEIIVIDVTGKKVFAQNLDAMGLYSTVIDLSNKAKGIYTLQLKTTEGFVARTLSIE